MWAKSFCAPTAKTHGPDCGPLAVPSCALALMVLSCLLRLPARHVADLLTLSVQLSRTHGPLSQRLGTCGHPLIPRRCARSAAWTRSRTPSLLNIPDSWLRTVFSLTPRRLAMCVVLCAATI